MLEQLSIKVRRPVHQSVRLPAQQVLPRLQQLASSRSLNAVPYICPEAFPPRSAIMKFLAGLAALASVAAAAPSAPTPLDVQLEMTGNSQVKATITNHGKNNLRIFKTGTILDKSAIQKVQITGEGKVPLNTPTLSAMTNNEPRRQGRLLPRHPSAHQHPQHQG